MTGADDDVVELPVERSNEAEVAVGVELNAGKERDPVGGTAEALKLEGGPAGPAVPIGRDGKPDEGIGMIDGAAVGSGIPVGMKESDCPGKGGEREDDDGLG